MLKLIMLMSTLNEKKINFHCCTALTNNEVQVRRKCEIITQGTLSLLFVPTYEQKWRGSSGRSWGGYLEVCLTFNKILKKALKRQLNIDCLLIAERGGEGRNHCNKFLSKKKKKKPNHPFTNVINITELKSLFKDTAHGKWDLDNLNSPKLYVTNVHLTSINHNDTFMISSYVISSKYPFTCWASSFHCELIMSPKSIFPL